MIKESLLPELNSQGCDIQFVVVVGAHYEVGSLLAVLDQVGLGHGLRRVDDDNYFNREVTCIVIVKNIEIKKNNTHAS